MQFSTRTKEAVIADLMRKLEELPETNPNRRELNRMIRDHKAEIEQNPQEEKTPKS
jgi:hypothetical protein